jgi:putative flippase GtrA
MLRALQRCGFGSHSLKRTFRFCTVGGFVFLLDFCLLYFLAKWFYAGWAVTIAYFVAVTTHYLLNKAWVFESRAPLSLLEAARYGCTVVICWACTISTVWLVLKFLSENILIAKAIAVPPTTLLSFKLMRGFVFRSPDLSPAELNG